MEVKTCTIDGCNQPPKARGWCRKHYNRWHRHGDPSIKQQLKPCGTVAGYRRHKDRGEEACKPCLLAMNKYNRERRAEQRTMNVTATIGECGTCKHPMVARKTPSTHVPDGHRRAQNETECARCYNKARRAQANAQVQAKIPDRELAQIRQAQTNAAYQAWSQQRAERIAKAQARRNKLFTHNALDRS